MTTPGVGAIVALTFASAIDDPARFQSSRRVGAHFGLTPRKHQSGETDVTGRISRIGDHGVRLALYEAANVILTRAVRGTDLKNWALGVVKRAGIKKAVGCRVAPHSDDPPHTPWFVSPTHGASALSSAPTVGNPIRPLQPETV